MNGLLLFIGKMKPGQCLLFDTIDNIFSILPESVFAAINYSLRQIVDEIAASPPNSHTVRRVTKKQLIIRR